MILHGSDGDGSPQLLFVLGGLPIGPVRDVLALAVVVLTVVAWVIAARQALDVSTGRSVAICVIAYCIAIGVTALIPGI